MPNLDPIDIDYVNESGKNLFHHIAEGKQVPLFFALVNSRHIGQYDIKVALNKPILNQNMEGLPLVLCASNVDLARAFISYGAMPEYLTFHFCYAHFANSSA